MSKRNRYKQLEQMLTVGLISDGVLFVLYLICAAIVWLKVVLAVLAILLSLACLAVLYLTKELLRQRSLWLTTGFFSVLLCIVVSLILAFP